MFRIEKKIEKIIKAGYVVMPEDKFDGIFADAKNGKELKRKYIRVSKKYNNLLKDTVNTLTIKDMREHLAAEGVVETPNKKAELIDLYIKTFSE